MPTASSSSRARTRSRRRSVGARSSTPRRTTSASCPSCTATSTPTSSRSRCARTTGSSAATPTTSRRRSRPSRPRCAPISTGCTGTRGSSSVPWSGTRTAETAASSSAAVISRTASAGWAKRRATTRRRRPISRSTTWPRAARARRAATEFEFGAISAGLVVAVVLAVVAFLQRNEARHQATVARARELVASSTASLPNDPELGLWFAVEAERTQSSVRADQLLRQGVDESRLRRTYTPPGGTAHPAYKVLAVSPDLRRFVAQSTGASKAVTIRELRTGRVVSRLAVRGPIYDPAFNATGSQVVTEGAATELWDTETGRRLASMPLGQRPSFSADGTRLAIAGLDAVEIYETDGTFGDHASAPASPTPCSTTTGGSQSPGKTATRARSRRSSGTSSPGSPLFRSAATPSERRRTSRPSARRPTSSRPVTRAASCASSISSNPSAPRRRAPRTHQPGSERRVQP